MDGFDFFFGAFSIITFIFPLIFFWIFAFIILTIIKSATSIRKKQNEVFNRMPTAPINTAVPEQKLEPIVCPGCGATNEANTKKCPYCDRML